MANDSKTGADRSGDSLDRAAKQLQKAVGDLVRVCQYRDKQRVAKYDVSVTQWYALNALINNGSLTLNGLAAELYLDKSTASRVVDALEAEKYGKRQVDPKDARALCLVATEKGKQVYARILKDLESDIKGLLSKMTADGKKTVVGAVSQLAESAVEQFGNK